MVGWLDFWRNHRKSFRSSEPPQEDQTLLRGSSNLLINTQLHQIPLEPLKGHSTIMHLCIVFKDPRPRTFVRVSGASSRTNRTPSRKPYIIERPWDIVRGPYLYPAEPSTTTYCSDCTVRWNLNGKQRNSGVRASRRSDGLYLEAWQRSSQPYEGRWEP